MNITFSKSNVEYQEQFREVFKALKIKEDALTLEQIKLGYQHRDELISHVLSGYKKDTKLLSKKKGWVNVGLEQRVVKWIYDLMRDKRDLYGYFDQPEDIIKELKNLIKLSEEKEYYEIAEILSRWYSKLTINVLTNN